MLVGRYDQNIDPKGRVNIPSKFRSSLGDTFVVAIGEGKKCATIYPLDEWQAFMDRVKAVAVEDRAMMMRYIQNTSTECGLDSQGRVVIPPDVRRATELTKEIVVVGMDNKIEVWSLDNWTDYSEKEFDMDKIDDILKQIGI